MLRNTSAIDGYFIVASDGHLGTVTDFLFDDVSRRASDLTKITDRRQELHRACFAVRHQCPNRPLSQPVAIRSTTRR